MPNDYFDAYHNQWRVSSLCSVWNTNDSFVCFFLYRVRYLNIKLITVLTYGRHSIKSMPVKLDHQGMFCWTQLLSGCFFFFLYYVRYMNQQTLLYILSVPEFSSLFFMCASVYLFCVRP